MQINPIPSFIIYIYIFDSVLPYSLSYLPAAEIYNHLDSKLFHNLSILSRYNILTAKAFRWHQFSVVGLVLIEGKGGQRFNVQKYYNSHQLTLHESISGAVRLSLTLSKETWI